MTYSWIGGHSWPTYLEFEPSQVNFQSVRGITSQFDVPGYEAASDIVNGEEVKEWYDLCGTISMTWIQQELGGTLSAQQVVGELVLEVSRDVATGTLQFDALERLARNRLGLKTAYGHDYEWEQNYDNYFKRAIRPHLNGSQWPIIAINIKNIGHPDYRVINESDIGHFVVVTGLSSSTDWAKGREWRWVRIYNPIYDRQEYYQAEVDPNKAEADLAEDKVGIFNSQQYPRTILWISKQEISGIS
jgi:hypothetical protein